jgi:hypothetical protein
LPAARIPTASATLGKDTPMSSEPLTAAPADVSSSVTSAEKGLLIAVLLLVLLGVGGMLYMV